MCIPGKFRLEYRYCARKGWAVVQRRITYLLVLSFLAVFFASAVSGQGIFATLTGVVSDPSGAVVSDSKITLRDAISGSLRDTVTNADGYFTFASVPVGTYVLTVEAKGFQTYKAEGIALGGAEKRNLNIQLTVGTTSQTVEVNAQETPLVTTDSAEKSYTLESKELQNLVQVGSDAAEYIKIMPGFGVQNGSSNKANYTGEVIGINANGDGGSQSPLNNAYTYNGLPSNSLDITADGAHVSDPGCDCDTPVNPNSDFLQEFKVLARELQRREPERADTHHIGDEGRWPGVPRQPLFLCPQLCNERQRLAKQRRPRPETEE